MIKSISLTKARNNLGKLSQGVAFSRDIVFFERDGTPESALVDLDLLQDMYENSNGVPADMRKGFQEYLDGKSRDVYEFLKELEG